MHTSDMPLCCWRYGRLLCTRAGLQVWEVIHKGAGYGALLLAVAAILTGLAKLAPKPSQAVVGLYIAWAVLTAVLFVGLEVLRVDPGPPEPPPPPPHANDGS
jgi:hypothetical protein